MGLRRVASAEPGDALWSALSVEDLPGGGAGMLALLDGDHAVHQYVLDPGWTEHRLIETGTGPTTETGRDQTARVSPQTPYQS